MIYGLPPVYFHSQPRQYAPGLRPLSPIYGTHYITICSHCAGEETKVDYDPSELRHKSLDNLSVQVMVAAASGSFILLGQQCMYMDSEGNNVQTSAP